MGEVRVRKGGVSIVCSLREGGSGMSLVLSLPRPELKPHTESLGGG